MDSEYLSSSRFHHVGIDTSKSQEIVRPSITYWQDAWRRLKLNKIAVLGMALIIIFVIMALIGPLICSSDPYVTDFMNTNQNPSSEHWFGTDAIGRDLWSRVWVGARVSLFIGFVAALIDTVIGVFVGGIAGYFGGKIDMLIMRFIDVMIAIPYMIFIILIMVIIGQGVVPIILSFAITGWLGMARLVRGQVLQLKEQEFVLVARTLGADSGRIIFKHLIPNSLGVIIVNLTMRIPQAIFSEAFLSFIGLGVKPPMPSWGQLASTGTEVMRVYPLQLIIPAILISLTMLSLNLFGDGLRDALDPKMRR